MSGGEWLIRQTPCNATSGAFRTERITIEPGASGEPEPFPFRETYALTFHYADGHILIFPWANIVRAEYRPHPQP